MTDTVCLDGRLLPAAEACLGVLDHGILYGCGLFETVRVYDGRFFRLEAHLQRLAGGAEQLGMTVPWERETLRRALRETAQAHGFGDGVLRLTVTGGAVAAGGPPHYFITARQAPAAAALERGVSACLAGTHPYPALPAVKSLNYLPFLLARRQARSQGYDEAILARGGVLVEASTSNLFLVRGGAIVTPHLGSGCLPGVTRSALLEVARAASLPCHEAALDVRELDLCEEAFLTNSVEGILPILRLEGRVLGNSPEPVTRRLSSLFTKLLQRELRTTAPNEPVSK